MLKLLSVIQLLFLSLAITYADSIKLDKVLVVVNDEAITEHDYKTTYRGYALEHDLPTTVIITGGENRQAKYENDVIDMLVTEAVLKQRAKDLRLKVSDEEVNRAIESVLKRNKMDMTQLQAELSNEGITLTEFKKDIADQQLIRKLVDREVGAHVVVTEQEVKDHIKLNSLNAQLAEEEAYELSHLVINLSENIVINLSENINQNESQNAQKLEQIEQIRKEIIDGLEFAQAVEKYSDGVKEEGGYLGVRKANQLPESFLSVLRATVPKSITTVINEANGYHLLFLHRKSVASETVEQQHIRHILVGAHPELTETELEEKARGVYQLLKDGESFESLARLHSDDAQSRVRGGDLGWVNPGTTEPAFEDAASKLTLNEISKPVRTDYGYHIIQVLDRLQRDISDEKLKISSRRMIRRQRIEERYQLWIETLRNNAYIEYIETGLGQ